MRGRAEREREEREPQRAEACGVGPQHHAMDKRRPTPPFAFLSFFAGIPYVGLVTFFSGRALRRVAEHKKEIGYETVEGVWRRQGKGRPHSPPFPIDHLSPSPNPPPSSRLTFPSRRSTQGTSTGPRAASTSGLHSPFSLAWLQP